MPSPEKSRIVVLHQTRYSDHGIVLHAIDSLYGRRSFLVRGLRRSSATAAFHPLSLLEVVSSSSPKSTLATLREWEPVRTLPGIRGDMAKACVAMFLSEVLYRSFTSSLADDELFAWISEAVTMLDAEEGSMANFHLWFLAGYVVKLGFMPAGTIEPPGIFTPEETALFLQILRSTYGQTLAIPLSSARRRDFASKILQYLSWHLGVTIDARSLDVLHEVLA